MQLLSKIYCLPFLIFPHLLKKSTDWLAHANGNQNKITFLPVGGEFHSVACYVHLNAALFIFFRLLMEIEA